MMGRLLLYLQGLELPILPPVHKLWVIIEAILGLARVKWFLPWRQLLLLRSWLGVGRGRVSMRANG